MGFEYTWHDINKGTPRYYEKVLLIDNMNNYWIGQWEHKWYVYEGDERYEITEYTQKFIAWSALPAFRDVDILSDHDKKCLEKLRELAVAVGGKPKDVVKNENGSFNIPKQLAAAIPTLVEEKDLQTIEIGET